MSESKIEWTDKTWNPVTGCSKISDGCKNCYAERMALRLQLMGQKNYQNGFRVTTHEHMLNLPLKWKKPHRIFVNSMSDLFHYNVPFDFINKVFDVMNQASWHTFQILTKRSALLAELSRKLNWTSNIWMGVTVENQDAVKRIADLRKTNAHVKFLSLEPLLEPIYNINLSGIDWVIVGGESGPKARPMREQWVCNVKDQCDENNVPFFFKQWGGVNKRQAGRLLLNEIWDAMPNSDNIHKATGLTEAVIRVASDS
jgi:protein gp37